MAASWGQAIPRKGGVGRRIPKGKEGRGVKAKRKRHKVTKGEWYKVI